MMTSQITRAYLFQKLQDPNETRLVWESADIKEYSWNAEWQLLMTFDYDITFMEKVEI